MKICTPCFAALLLCGVGAADAALLPVSSYSYIAGPSGSYPDSGGELTDGVDANVAWGAGLILTYADVEPLVGWDGRSPSVTFYFASPRTVGQVVVWAADSNGAAGVGLPDAITLTTSGGFSQSFVITNPAGDGHTVALTLSGFSFTSDNFTITASPHDYWTMLSEVQAYDVPEPAGLMLMGVGGVLMAARRVRGTALTCGAGASFRDFPARVGRG